MEKGIALKALPTKKKFFKMLADSPAPVKASCFIMGLGQFIYKQWGKGIMYLLILGGFVTYFVTSGVEDFIGLFTLGTTMGVPGLGGGDNSITMLIRGILAVLILVFFIMLYISNIRDAYNISVYIREGKKPKSLGKSISSLVDEKFYATALVLPIVGVCVFNVLPIVFMICLAFTNYGGKILPPILVDWVGFDNFIKLVTLATLAPTIGKIFAWNVLWAVSSTFVNYFGGLGLALLLNKKCVKLKKFWRIFPILAYALPGFISLLGFKFMFSYGGPINQLLTANGMSKIGFLDQDAKWMARGIGLAVNAWISIPTSMLLATGILSNMNTDLYEAAEIDGAGKWVQFIKLTMPFVLFATTPVLISQFIGNFNNFGIFFFLRDGLISDGYFLASDTDLLINWLYNLSINNKLYSLGAAVSILIFIFTSGVALVVYVLSPAYKREDTYK